ncbi:MAG: GcrA cell cycle regulator [Hyphomicrobiales bacterium]|nr:GcrA cell cycle regulator [Hyphomicrobiales bacterium]
MNAPLSRQKSLEGHSSGQVSIMALQEGVCRWPMDRSSSGHQLFCGEACGHTKEVYCSEHQARSLAPPKRR